MDINLFVFLSRLLKLLSITSWDVTNSYLTNNNYKRRNQKRRKVEAFIHIRGYSYSQDTNYTANISKQAADSSCLIYDELILLHRRRNMFFCSTFHHPFQYPHLLVNANCQPLHSIFPPLFCLSDFVKIISIS